MSLIKCPECGSYLTQEMIDVNMCWECGKILDASQLDEDSIKRVDEQAEEDIMYDYLQCPVCGKKHHFNAKKCECGCILINNPTLNIREVAEIYNNRLEQYKKNPLYEYDYIIVPNKDDGSTNADKIRSIIINHAMQGWRLVTMYSNELGKNSMGVAVGGIGGGSNTTMCEDIMVFERCIKAGE